jgi:uncharacterized membrane protein YgcG
MRKLELASLAATALLGAGLLSGCTGGTLPVSQYPPGYHVGGIDEGAMLTSGRQLAITLAPDGTIVPKTAPQTAGTADPPAIGPQAQANPSRANPFAAGAPLGRSAPAPHAAGAHTGGARAGGGGGHGGGGGGGSAGGGH